MPKHSEIIVPDLGLFTDYRAEAVPRVMKEGRLHIGLHDCRNISLSRKAGVIKKSKGIANFTNSATGATDSVRGIGVLDKFAIPQNFESGAEDIIGVGASGDDAIAYGASSYSITATLLAAGKLAPIRPLVRPEVSTDDVYTDDTTFYTVSDTIKMGADFSAGIRFPSVAVANGATITEAILAVWKVEKPGSLTDMGTIYGEDVDDSATFSDLANFDARTRTTAKVDLGTNTEENNWVMWDVTAIIQEIVNRGGWATGQDMAILIDNNPLHLVDYYISTYAYEHPLYSGYRAVLKISVGGQVTYHFGAKFSGIAGASQGDTITSARLKLKLDIQSPDGPPTLRIYGHNADTAWRDTGTHTGGNDEATVMTDSTASWIVDALIGMTIKNVTDGSTGTIEDNDATTVTVASLAGGTDNDWDTNDKYEIYEPTHRTVWDAMQDHLTTAYVDWSLDTSDIASGDWVYTPDLSAIVQEIVDRAGWDEDTMAFFIKDNSSASDTVLIVRAYDYSGNADGPVLEFSTELALATSAKFFMFVKGATEGEVHKLDENRDPSDVSQVAEAYADEYQSQIGKFRQFGNDLIFSDDGKSDPQIWDVSTGPTNLIDLTTAVRGRYVNEFKSRLWIWFTVISGTINKSKGVYSAVIDPTSFTVADDFLTLPGPDAVRFAINLSEDMQIVFKENSSHRVVDRQTTASDFQVYRISGQDGSLGANVVSDGARLYGINAKGVFQWPVQGYPAGFRYIHGPIKNEVDKITLQKMNLVWFCHDPTNKLIKMNCPDNLSTRNVRCIDFNYEKDLWENISDINFGNVMLDAFDQTGNPIILMGKQDGHLKQITGEDNEGSDFEGYLDTGALFLRDKEGRIVSRKLLSIDPISNYEGSYTLEFYQKAYDRPADEPSMVWGDAFTHEGRIGSEEIIPIKDAEMAKFHKIRVKGTLKDEAFEIQALRVTFEVGGIG